MPIQTKCSLIWAKQCQPSQLRNIFQPVQTAMNNILATQVFIIPRHQNKISAPNPLMFPFILVKNILNSLLVSAPAALSYFTLGSAVLNSSKVVRWNWGIYEVESGYAVVLEIIVLLTGGIQEAGPGKNGRKMFQLFSRFTKKTLVLIFLQKKRF